MSRLRFLRQLRAFNVWSKILEIFFYPSYVVMYFGINKVDKLISKAGFVIGWTLSCGGEEVTDQTNDPSWSLTGLTDTLEKKTQIRKYKHYEKKAQNYSFNVHFCWLFLLYYFDISYDLTWIINLSFYIWIILCVYMSMHECLYLFFDSGNMGFHKCQFLTT